MYIGDSFAVGCSFKYPTPTLVLLPTVVTTAQLPYQVQPTACSLSSRTGSNQAKCNVTRTLHEKS